MAYEIKDNSGTLFRNERREKDTHPHATGTAMIDGVEYYVSAWTKDGRKGKFQSLAFTRKDAAKSTATKRTYADESDGYGRQPADLGDDLPF